MDDLTLLNGTCTSGSCGTGECGTGLFPPEGTVRPPVSGDANNTAYIVAIPTLNGVDVKWNLPTVNPRGVSYYEVYRSGNSNFNSASMLGTTGGTVYQDSITIKQDAVYYYWVVLVTLSGISLTPVGPAIARKNSTVADIIEAITGEIDNGVLAGSLKEDIAQITLNRRDLNDEIAARIAGNAELADAFQRVQDGLDQSIAFMYEETQKRIDGDDASIRVINLLAAANQNNTALIEQERIARVNADGALSTTIDRNMAATNDNIAAAVRQEATARTNADTALGQQITTVQSSMNGQIASVEQTMQTQINTVNGKVTSIGALWTARVSVNGLVGGFGIYNNGQTVEAGFDVDTFWVGKTNANKRKPFIIRDGITYIDDALIHSLTFDKLRSSDGNLVFENGVLKARYLEVDTLSIKGGAVTAMTVSEYGNMGISVGSGSPVAVAGSIDMPVGGSGVMVQVILSAKSGHYANYYLVVQRDDGVLIGSRHIYMVGDVDICTTVPGIDRNPRAGWNTYYAYVSSGGGPSITFTKPTMLLTGAKR